MAQGCRRIVDIVDSIRRTAVIPAPSACTMAVWAKRETTADTNAYLLVLGRSDNAASCFVRYSATSNTYELSATSATAVNFSSNPYASEDQGWLYYAMTMTGTGGARDRKGYILSPDGSVFATATLTLGGGSDYTSNFMVIGGNANAANGGTGPLITQFNGLVAQGRVWDAALTQAELITEALSSTPVITANLNTAFEDDPATDVSGNARPWTVANLDIVTSDWPPNYPSGVRSRMTLLGVG